MFIAHLHQLLRLYTIGWMNLKVVVHSHMHLVWEVQLRLPKIIDKIHDIVLTDRWMKVRELVKATCISYGTVISILHEQLEKAMNPLLHRRRNSQNNLDFTGWTSSEKAVKSAGKMIATVFWDARGIIRIDYFFVEINDQWRLLLPYWTILTTF